MNLLPGQTIVNGVSNYLFGSNVPPDYNVHNARNTPQIQALIKQAGITLLRCAIQKNNPDSYIEQTAQAVAACGAQMLVILDFSAGISWPLHVVSYLGSRCNLYEFRNEPDLGGISWQKYLSDWNTVIPQLRAINPGAAFIGPVLGVYANVGSYLTPWLQGCMSSGVMPDGISFHNYPCTGTSDSATCATKSDRLGVSAMKLDAVVQGIVGHSLPLCLTEWHIHANPTTESYMTNSSFITTWTKQAIDSMVAANVAMACQFDAGSGAAGGKLDLISTSSYQPQPMYGAMKERIQFYLGGNVTTSNIAASPGNLSFTGTAGGSTLAAQLVTLTNSGNASANYSVTAPSWVDVSPSSGTVGASASVGSLVSVNLTGLAPDEYKGTITYTYGVKSVTVGVSLTVQAAPGLRTVKSGPFTVGITPETFQHGLGEVPDFVVTGISNSAVPGAHACYADPALFTKDTVTLSGDADGLTVYILAIKQ